MLLDYAELASMCLKKQAQQDLAEEISAQLIDNPMLSALRAYAVARALLNVIETVTERTGLAAEKYCQENGSPLNTEFAEDEMLFIRQFSQVFDHATYMRYDEDGTYAAAHRKLTAAERELKLRKLEEKNARKTIEENHPKMVPDSSKTILKFQGVKADKK